MTKEEDEQEIEKLRAKLSELSGAANKKKRNRINKQIREIEDAQKPRSDENIENQASSKKKSQRGDSTAGETPFVLKEASLPPFAPKRSVLNLTTGPTPTLMYAFLANIPPFLRPAFAVEQSVESLASNTSPATQWNYSLFHLAHYYSEARCSRFILEDEKERASILLDITSLKACPDSKGQMKELARQDFVDPNRAAGEEKSTLGAVPIFFVRYLYTSGSKHLSKAWQPPFGAAVKFIEAGPIMKIIATSIEEVHFAYKELQRVEQFLPSSRGHTQKKEAFRNSAIFPSSTLKCAKQPKPEYVCASCDIPLSSGKRLLFCSQCKVTYYCSKECQRKHWIAGHKTMCQPASKRYTDAADSKRPSFIFEVQTKEGADALSDKKYRLSISHKTGDVSVAGMTKEQRDSLSAIGTKVNKVPLPRNVHGDREFIVKIQPPLLGTGAWMCYDGPARSFNAYIPGQTHGLEDCYKKLQRDGIKSVHPILGSPGYKAYCMARWEGSFLRVYYDRFAPQQSW